MCHDLISFSFSDRLKTFSFSAKTNEIVFPESIRTMSDEEFEVIKQFCIIVREIYMKKVVQFNVSNIGRKICPIQLKHSAIQEAVIFMQNKISKNIFDPIYTQFQSLQNSTKKKSLNTPRPKKSTLLDNIESATEIL